MRAVAQLRDNRFYRKTLSIEILRIAHTMAVHAPGFIAAQIIGALLALLLLSRLFHGTWLGLDKPPREL